MPDPGQHASSRDQPALPPEDKARRLARALAGGQAEFGSMVEPHRHELLTHCYRMLGSLQDAEDSLQETLLRAWRRLETFQGRSSFRAWLYKIATNACLDALSHRSRRSLPVYVYPPADPHQPLPPPVMDPVWLEPFPDDWLAPAESGPEARYAAREGITLAFLAALQLLPPRQRAAILLCDVLDWSAGEVAELLDTTSAAVHSLLRRARVTLDGNYRPTGGGAFPAGPIDDQTSELLDRYLRAWEDADIETLVSLLKADATFPMPPLAAWFRGRAAIRAFVESSILDGDAAGRWRLLPVRANAQPGFAWYQRLAGEGQYQAYAIQVLTFAGELIADATTFALPGLFAAFGLPEFIES
jgi:RNA polymerase sigma-70 factor (ECF subfamily)